MARDAIPQHEIDEIVNKLAQGEELERIQRASPTIAKAWFERNKDALYKRARVTPPGGEPEPVSDEGQGGEPDDAEGKKGKKGKK